MKQYLYLKEINGKLLSKTVEGINRHTETIDYKPSVFIRAKENTPCSFKNFANEPLKQLTFDSIRNFKTFIYENADTSNGETLYGNKKVEYQYIADYFNEREEYSISAFNVLYFDIETARSETLGYAPASNPFNPVTLITAYFKKNVYVWATRGDYDGEGCEEYRIFDDDIKMIEDFFSFLLEKNIDILTGWNIELYDIPYLVGRYIRNDNRNDNADPKKTLFQSKDYKFPFHIVKKKIIKGNYGNEELVYDIPGWICLDYMQLYKKFTYVTRESYSLNHISFCELGEKKVDYSEHSHLESLYNNDYTKFVQYGIKDTILVYKLNHKLKLIELAITLAYKIGCNVQDIFSPVKSWEVYIYNETMKKGFVAPMMKKTVMSNSYIGAYVKDPIPGKYQWVVSFDLNSLYPHIMLFCNMSPETYIQPHALPFELESIRAKMKENLDITIESLVKAETNLSLLKKYNATCAANGAMFKKDTLGFIPEIIKRLYNERKEAKKKMLQKKQELEYDSDNFALQEQVASLNAQQMAIKIQLNSLYGAFGNEHFLYYTRDIAEGITATGQLAIKYISHKLNQFMNAICKSEDNDFIRYVDTDSTLIDLSLIAEKIPANNDERMVNALDRFSEEKIQPFIENSYIALADYMNAYEPAFHMKREKICKSIIFIAKKRYIAAILNDEGVAYTEPKVKCTGVESVRSTTPAIIRDWLHELEKILLLGTEQQARELLKKRKTDFFALPIQEIAITKSVNEIEKWFDGMKCKTGTPQQVKAATLYNNIMLAKDKHAETIKSKDKIKLVYIKPSPLFNSENCIAFPQIIPKELGLTKEMVDYKKMWETVFISAAQILMGAIGLNAEQKIAVSIDSFF